MDLLVYGMMEFIMVIVIFLLFCFLLGCPSQTQATVAFEQQINITDQAFATTTATLSAEPADNRLGIIHWDGTRYSDDTVYFEAIVKCVGCSGGNTQVKAGLYKTDGTLVTNSTVTTINSTDTLVRSGTITTNLTDNTDYSVRLSLDATSGSASIKAARLIIAQSATAITQTETQIEVGNNTSSTNTVYELISGPKIYHHDTTVFAPSPSINFEATLKSSTSEGIAYAALSSVSDCSSTVTGSEVTVTGTTWGRSPTSSTISLNNNTDYFVCIKSSAGQTTSLANAKIVFTQSNTMGISKVELHHQLINTPVTASSDTYLSQLFPITYDPNRFTGARFNYYFESILQATAGTAYSQLYNVSDSASITDSENSVTSTNYNRIRSKEITASLPSSAKNLDTQIKNSGNGTTVTTASHLIVPLSLYPELSFTVAAVPSNTVTNGITTTNVSQVTTIDFGYLLPGVPKYIAHKLSAKTTAGSGYSVTTKLFNTLQGNYPANIIEAFPASWTSPETWYSPTGTSPNVNSGWIGANTSDTRVPNWSSASGKFGGIGTTAVKVMQATDIDSGTDAYVTYAIEVNGKQPTDTYYGTIVYNIVPTY